jgi:hypothetical protein
VNLRDGRKLRVPVSVDTPRPQVTLLSKGVQEDGAAVPSPVHFGSPDDLPVNGRIVFFLKSRVPANFLRNVKVEVAATDGSFRTLLGLTDSSLMLEDAKTAMGVVEPLVRFGSSAFGPIRARIMSGEGIAGDWLPLGTLVRVPGFKELRCPKAAAKPCTLTGTNLFLAASFGATPGLDNAVDVLLDFTGTQLTVPHATGGVLYLKLRDDPATVQTVTLPVTLQPASAVPLERPVEAKPDAAVEGKPVAPVGGKSATEAPPAVPAEPAGR